MGKTQQTAWLAGFLGLSATCGISLVVSSVSDSKNPADTVTAAQPHALLAATAPAAARCAPPVRPSPRATW